MSSYTSYNDGILPKGSYPPCLRMADRAPLTGYPRSRWSLCKCCRLGFQERIHCCDWNMNMNTLPVKSCIQLASGLSAESALYPGLKPALMGQSGGLSLWIVMATYMYHHFTWISCIPGCLWHPWWASICLISCLFPRKSQVHISSGNGMVSSGNKPQPGPMLIQIHDVIWRH